MSCKSGAYQRLRHPQARHLPEATATSSLALTSDQCALEFGVYQRLRYPQVRHLPATKVPSSSALQTSVRAGTRAKVTLGGNVRVHLPFVPWMGVRLAERRRRPARFWQRFGLI